MGVFTLSEVDRGQNLGPESAAKLQVPAGGHESEVEMLGKALEVLEKNVQQLDDSMVRAAHLRLRNGEVRA
eukprot:4093877-Prorocentrum_lima.AAC.1